MNSILKKIINKTRHRSGDKYDSFLELSMNEDKFSVEVQDIGAPITIMAIHGGRIEPGTSNIAKTIAGRDFNYYCFNGEKLTHNWDLHITSDLFDDQQALALASRSELVITIHGCVGSGKVAYTGGNNEVLRLMLEKELNDKSIQSRAHPTFNGQGFNNICNKGIGSMGGVQFELTGWLRCFSLFKRRRFINTVRQVLLSQ